MIIDTNLLDETSNRAKCNEHLRMNYNFHESWESKAQIMLNTLEPRTTIPIGRHMFTTETFVVLRGALKIIFYDDDKNIIYEDILNPSAGKYGVFIPKGQWHKVKALVSNMLNFLK